MDRIDLRIFSHLVADPFVSDEHLGRDVGLTGKAVRLRRRRLERGPLAEYAVHPRAGLLRRHVLSWGYVGPSAARLPITRLREVDDLVLVRRFQPDLCVALRFVTAADAEDDPRLARLLGRPLEGPTERGEAVGGRPTPPLSRTDWTVLEEIVRSPRATLSALSDAAGLSLKTFRTHRSRLLAQGALERSVILDLEREGGLPTYGLWLKVNDDFQERTLGLAKLWDRPHWTRSPRGVYLLGSAESYFEARQVEQELRSSPGVVGADPLVPAGGYFDRERVLQWIRAERARSAPRRVVDGLAS